MNPVMQELWRQDAPRRFSDAAVARILQVTPAYISKLRSQRGFLPRRKKVPYHGAAGGRGLPRYSFLETVAAEVARIAAEEFEWSPDTLRRLIDLVGSGDESQVRAAAVAIVEGTKPATVRHALLGPAETSKKPTHIIDQHGSRARILKTVPLIEIVEATANALYDRMVSLGIDFEGVAAAAPKRRS